jgi:hypothetical protein
MSTGLNRNDVEMDLKRKAAQTAAERVEKTGGKPKIHLGRFYNRQAERRKKKPRQSQRQG